MDCRIGPFPVPIKDSEIIHTVAGQQPQKSPSLLHTAGTPQSHLSLGLNSNMTVTSKAKLLTIHNLCLRWRANETTESSSCGPG